MEAEVDANQTTYKVQYNLTILAANMTDKEAVARDIKLLEIGYTAGDDEKHVRNRLSLPTAGRNGSSITWTSSRAEWVNTADGSVSRPSTGDQTVTLTAKVTKGLESDNRQFHLIVLKNNTNVEQPKEPIKEPTKEPEQLQSDFYIDFITQNNQKERIKLTQSQVKSGLIEIDKKTEKGYFEVSGETAYKLLRLNPSFAFQITTAGGIMKLPVSELISSANNQFVGKNSEKINFSIYVGETEASVPLLNDLKSRSAKLLSGPIQFKIIMSIGDEAGIAIAQLGSKVERRIVVPNTATDTIVAVWNEQLKGLEYVPVRYENIGRQVYALLPVSSDGLYLNIVNQKTFADMKRHWAKKEAEKLASMLIFEGKGEGIFDPNAHLTRAETAALLVRALGNPVPAHTVEFPDIDGQWYEVAVTSATEAGFMNGYEDGSFRPNDFVSREELAVILSRVIEYDSSTDSNAPENHSIQFNDSKDVSKWATEAVQKINSNVIMIGDNEDNFRPHHTTTRAEMAIILSRLLSKLGYM
nr:S-layer homology domain-containing protein [Lysinibacillus sp. ZYM-1]